MNKGGLERVNQVKLQPVQPGLHLSWLYSCSQGGVQKVAVEGAPMPPGESGYRVLPDLPQRINAMLQNVGRRSLIAFRKRCNHRILFLPQPCITKLQVPPIFLLTEARVHQVRMGLLS